jgi:hypothetical protein
MQGQIEHGEGHRFQHRRHQPEGEDDGRQTVMVMPDGKTKVTKGKTKIDVAALKVGNRVVAEGPEEKNMIMATMVRVGEAPATAKK